MRKRTIAAAAVGGVTVLLLPGAAHAGSSGRRICQAGLCIDVTAIEDVTCGTIFGGWQCTPRASVSSIPSGWQQPNSIATNSWSVSATCEYRLKADGFTTGYSAWASCTPPSQSNSYTAFWTAGESFKGGTVTVTWGQITNHDTWGTQDCVEVRMRVTASAYIEQQPFGGTATRSSITFVHPSTGWDYGSICE